MLPLLVLNDGDLLYASSGEDIQTRQHSHDKVLNQDGDELHSHNDNRALVEIKVGVEDEHGKQHETDDGVDRILTTYGFIPSRTPTADHECNHREGAQKGESVLLVG